MDSLNTSTWTTRQIVTGRHIQPACTDNLIGPDQIGGSTKTAPHMNQSGEWEDQKEGHAQEHVQLEHPADAGCLLYTSRCV